MMTVKVVSDKPLKTKKVMCTICCYELEYTGVDVKSSSGYSMGEHDVSFYIECSNCKNTVSVSGWSCWNVK